MATTHTYSFSIATSHARDRSLRTVLLSDHRTTAYGHDDVVACTGPIATYSPTIVQRLAADTTISTSRPSQAKHASIEPVNQSTSQPPTACGRACVTRTYAQFAQTTTFKHGGRLHTADEQLTTTTMTITGSGGVGTYLSRGTSVSLRISFLGNGLTVGCSCSLASRENRQRNRVSTHWHKMDPGE